MNTYPYSKLENKIDINIISKQVQNAYLHCRNIHTWVGSYLAVWKTIGKQYMQLHVDELESLQNDQT